MNESLNTGQIALALARAQADCEAAEKNGKFANRGNYARLEDLQEKSQKAFGDNNLSLVMTPYSSAPGMFGIAWRLTHISGEFMGDRFEVPTSAKTPQDYGSNMTYYRRYVLAGLLPLMGDDDPDEQTMAVPTQATKTRQLPKQLPKSTPQKEDRVAAAVAKATPTPTVTDDDDEDF